MDFFLVFGILTIICLESSAHPSCEYRAQILESIESAMKTQLTTCQMKHPFELEPTTPSEGTTRLLGGPGLFTGRVEVFHDGTWGSICDEIFSTHEAAVACASMGFERKGALVFNGAVFGLMTEPIWLDTFSCDGTEPDLTQCNIADWGSHSVCDPYDPAGVSCTPKMRLVNGDGPMEGRVEIQLNGVWGTVCSNKFDDDDAGVVCAMLGYSRYGAKSCTVGFGEGSGPIYFSELDCDGDEFDISQCPSRPVRASGCCHSQDVGVICQPVPIRLADGRYPSEGRIEVFTNGSWGTVCNDFFDELDASVICHMLGYSRTGATIIDVPEGAGVINLDNLKCEGDEDTIMQCARTFGSNCGHDEDIGVSCQEDN